MTEPTKRAFPGTMIVGTNAGVLSPPAGDNPEAQGAPAAAPAPGAAVPPEAPGYFQTHRQEFDPGLDPRGAPPGGRPPTAEWPVAPQPGTFDPSTARGVGLEGSTPQPLETLTARGVGPGDASPRAPEGAWAKPAAKATFLGMGDPGGVNPPQSPREPATTRGVGGAPDAVRFEHSMPPQQLSPSHPPTLASGYTGVAQPPVPLHATGKMTMMGMGKRPLPEAPEQAVAQPDAAAFAPPGSPAVPVGKQTLFGTGATQPQQQVTQRSELPTAGSDEYGGQPWARRNAADHVTMPSAGPTPAEPPPPYGQPAPPYGSGAGSAQPKHGMSKATLFGIGTAATAQMQQQPEVAPLPAAASREQPQFGLAPQPQQVQSKTLFGIGTGAVMAPQPHAGMPGPQAVGGAPVPGQYGMASHQAASAPCGAPPGPSASPYAVPPYGAPPYGTPQYAPAPQGPSPFAAAPAPEPSVTGAKPPLGGDFAGAPPPMPPFAEVRGAGGAAPHPSGSPFGSSRETIQVGPQGYGNAAAQSSLPPPAPFPEGYPQNQHEYSAPPAAPAAASPGAQDHFTSPPAAVQTLPPKKSRGKALIVVGVVLVGGLLIAGAGVIYLWGGVTPPRPSVQVAAPTPAPPPPTTAASEKTGLTPTAAPVGSAGEGVPPAASGTVEPVADAGPVTAAAANGELTAPSVDAGLPPSTALAESSVLLECSPPCASLQSVVCDGTQTKFEGGILALTPGQHSCIFSAAGYASRRIPIEIIAGEPQQTVPVVLTRAAGRRRGASCGTFINPCD